MIDVLLTAGLALGSSALGALAGAVATKKREQARAARLEDELRAEHDRESRRVERRAVEQNQRHADEVGRLRAALLVPDSASRASALSRESERGLARAVAARLQGLAFIDFIAIADPSGLSLVPLEDDAARDAATLAASLVPWLRLGGGRALAEAHFELADARHVVARPLPDGSFLFVGATSQHPSPLALDAATAFAESASDAPPEPLVDARELFGDHARYGADRGEATQQLLAELERASAAMGTRLLLVCLQDEPLAGVVTDGASASARARFLGELPRLAAAASRRLRAPVRRCDVTTTRGTTLSFLPLTLGSRFTVVAQSGARPVEDRELERLAGRLRRLTSREPMPAQALEGGAS